jgi:protein-disulfide isomerase
LIALAARHGARGAAVKAAIASHAHAKSLDDDADLAEDFEANGTPHFFVNGRRLVGALPKEKFEAVIDEELRRARDLVAGGAKPHSVYDELIRGGKGPADPEKKVLPVPFPAHDPGRGNASARVTVHEWSDFQCPFCQRVEPTLEQVAREYGGRVRLVWHDLPLPMHANARLAARAAREAFAQKGERGFWAMHDDLFAHQDLLKRDDLDGYARQLGLDVARWNAALDGDAHEGDIDADREAADGMSISGTPGFLIVPAGSSSGYFIGGAQTYAKFRRLIDRAMVEAK